MFRVDTTTLTGAGRFLPGLIAGLVLLSPASLPAQTLEAPDGVCPADEFEVVWTGPDGAGDRITVAGGSAAPDQSFDTAPTADGSPATLRAPAEPGVYELRYVQDDPRSILARRNLVVLQCLAESSQSGAGAAGSELTAVLVTGTQVDFGDMINRAPDGPFGPANYSIDDVCAAGDEIGQALGMMMHQFDTSMQEGSPITFDSIEAMPGAPTRAGIARDLQNAREEICDQPQPGAVVQPFVITYAYCRMAMVTPSHLMDIHLPPGVGEATMSLADHASREVMLVRLRRDIDAVSETVGSGWSNQIDMDPTGAAGERIGYPVREYSFEYSAGLGGGGGGLQDISGMVSVTNTGTAWVSRDVPGIDIVRSFYENLTREVQPDQGATSFFAGLINNLVGMLQEGLPLEIDQTVDSKVMGRSSVKGRSINIVTGVRLVDFHPAWCSESLMPADYTVTDIDQQIQQATGGANASQQAEMAEAMRQYEEAMKNMTPEQKKMMEQMGMGDMMGQMMGGTAPGAQQRAPAPAPAPRSSGSSGQPLSQALQTDDPTETAQNYLQVLGYDTGTTSGEMTVETTIAISQFQAERGLEVTGEVSPQLLGVLAAEVDAL